MFVKVWNDNTYPFKQNLHNVEYKIPAGEYIELDEEEADKLLKAFSPIKVDYDGRALPSSYKKLRIDKEDKEKAIRSREARGKTGHYVCQACGYIASNKWELNGHVQDLHKDQFEDPEEALASLEEDKPKRGRSKKEA